MTVNPHEYDADGHPLPPDHDPHGEGAQAVAWQDDQPPHDDFGDHPEDGAAQAEGDVGADPAADQAAAKRRGKLVLLGALALIAVFAGGMAYFQFAGSGGGSSSVSPAMEAAAPPVAVPQPPVETAAPAPTTAEADLNAIYNAGRDGAAVNNSSAFPGSAEASRPSGTIASDVMTTSAPPPTDLVAANPAPPEVVPSPVAAPQPVAAPPSAPAAIPQGTGLPALVPPVPQPQSPPPAAVPPAAGANPALDARLNALAAQVETLQRSVEQTTQQTNQLAVRLETLPSVPGATSNPHLEDRLNRLEQQLSGLASSKPRHVSPSTSEMGLVVDQEPAARPSKAASRSEKSRPVAKPVSAKKTEKAWVLRAATPEAAWIAKDANSAELRRVQVGDSLPGIGKVKAIQQKGEAWVVVGSKGTLQ